MALARRMFQLSSVKTLIELIDVLLAIVRSGAADLTLANSAGETLASILGVEKIEHIEQQLTRIRNTSHAHDLPLSPLSLPVATYGPKSL
jgi:hypothetical protein